MSKTTVTTGGDSAEKSSRSVVTKTVEKTGGCRTTTTTIRSVTKDGIDEALGRLDIDPSKFRSGGTSVTKTIVYTDSSGKREVIEETIENYGDPDAIAKELKSKKDTIAKELNAKKDTIAKELNAKKDTIAKELNAKKDTITKEFAKKDATKKTTAKSPEKVRVVDPSSVQIGQFEEDCLKAHNECRAKHGVPKLALSKEMCAYSKEWADHLAATDSFKHRTQDRKYGENIFMKWSSDPSHTISGNEPVDSWYSEIKDHVFGKEPKSLKSGHFTQVIWNESKLLGVAWGRSKSGKILVVANYDPAGNFVGKFTHNVPPPKK